MNNDLPLWVLIAELIFRLRCTHFDSREVRFQRIGKRKRVPMLEAM